MTDAPAPEAPPPEAPPDTPNPGLSSVSPAESSPETPPPPGTANPIDEDWGIEVDHSAYYRWEPIKESDVTEGMVTIDSYWPGFKMQRVRVDEPTTTTTGVHVASLKQINEDRKAAGLAPRSHLSNLIRHLEDGPWPRHFPMDTITAIRCPANPALEGQLRSHFVGGETT